MTLKHGTTPLKAADIYFEDILIDTIYVAKDMEKQEVEAMLWQYDILIYDTIKFRSI